MASKSRGYSSQDWDPMRDDFDNSNYDPQYPDDSASGQVNLDHCRLYITNIPKGLNDDGLRGAFARYGTIVEAFVNKDQQKRFGLISYETPGEARQAMMKLNRTEPLKLNVSIAHKNKSKKEDWQNRNTNERNREHCDVTVGSRDRRGARDRDDGSIGSHGKNTRKSEEMANGDNSISIEDLPVDLDDGLQGLEALDPELQLELERLRMEQLKLQQAQLQCKQRMILNQASRKALAQNTASTRCVLPGGKVVVRNMPEGNTDDSFAAGAGDSRVASRKCVVCGSEADSFCARCGVTPYCSARCQQRDWAHRHRDVCHNLARDPKFEAEEDLSIVRPPAPALRRPHSPAQQRDSVNPTRDSDSPRNDDGATGANRKFMPAGFNKKPENSGFRYKNENSGPRNNNDNSGFRNKNENSGSREDNENSGFRKNNENSGFRKNNENSGFRKNDENSGSRRNNENSGFRKNDENSGFRKNNENSGFRKNDENSGFRKNDENSGFRKNHENSGFRKNDENSGFRKNNDDSGSRNNSTRGRPFNRGQDGGTGSGRNNQRYQNNGNRRTPNQPADEEEDWDSAKRSYPRGGSRGDRYKPFNQPLPLSDNDEEDWALKSIKPAEPAQAQETKPEPKEVKHTPPPKREPPKAAAPAQRAEAAREAPKAASMPPSSVDDVTPAKKIVPKNYVIETFSIGDTVLLQVDAAGAECRARAGFVCLALHERLGEQFESLCDTFAEECEADAAEYTLVPGESFAYLDAEDGGWYRARCLTPALAALLDASKLVPTAGCKCRKLPAAYELLPEFCCLLLSAHVKIGDSLRCTLQEKTPNGYKVTLENVETAAKVGDAEVTRWLPEVEYPKPAPPPARVVPAAAAPAVIPEVPRPDVAGNSKVLLVDMMALDRGFVRAADTPSQMQFDAVLQDVVLYGMSAKPLTEPPQKGQLVIAKYTDDMHYRALLKRTNVKQNKYLLEYVEFGNIQVTSLDSLYPCPVELQLQARPAMTSQVSLLSGDGDVTLTPAAIEHLEKIKDDNEELLLTLPSGAKAAPSGATVTLTVTKSNENLNRKLQAMCTPEWKQIEERGGDVIESECLMYNDLKYVDLPADGCELDILDITMIRSGTLSGCVKGLPLADYVFNQLTEKMGKYCNSELGREPYLPKAEELCIAQCPPYPQWFRAVFVGQEAGAGGAEAEVCYLDYGNLERVPVKLLRKMLPEFVRDLPAVANTLEIKDFPHDAPPEVLAQALQFMQVTNEGRGVLRAQRCVRDLETPGMYVIEAPDLIAALKGAIDRQA